MSSFKIVNTKDFFSVEGRYKKGPFPHTRSRYIFMGSLAINKKISEIFLEFFFKIFKKFSDKGWGYKPTIHENRGKAKYKNRNDQFNNPIYFDRNISAITGARFRPKNRAYFIQTQGII